MENKKLEFLTIKGMQGAARINNLNASVLEKALALNPNALIAKDEEGRPVFIITLTNEQSLVTNCSLEVNLDSVEDETLGIVIAGDEYTLVQAVPHIVALYDKAKELNKKYDDAKALIKEV